MSNKRYYWLKLKENFFEDDTVAWLEEQENGKDYVLFYLKLALKSLSEDGSLIRYVGERLMPYDTKALAKLTNTPIDTVAVAMKVFNEIGLVSIHETGEIFLNQINEMIGSETRQASIMRKNRVKETEIKKIAAANEASIPYIENYINRTRYGGNYYVVFGRDNQQCISCKAKENLCVHHIIGYDKANPTTSERNNLATLCRSCHGREHAVPYSIMTKELLRKIKFNFDYYDLIKEISNNTGSKKQASNIVTESYTNVNKRYTDIDKDKDLDLDLEKELELDKEKEKIPYAEIIGYLNKKANRQFRNVENNKKLIRARFNEGYDFEDFKKVVDNKVNEWTGTKWEQYLQPSTLFGTKFDNYLNQVVPKKVVGYDYSQDQF